MTERPNIIVLMVDQWRADCLGIDGHPVVETPTIDRIFRRGTVFRSAYAAVPSCIGARAGLLTGLEPRHHGRVGYQEGVPWEYEHTYASLLTASGYQSHCIGKMHVWPARRRMGFESVDLHDGYTGFERRWPRDLRLVDDYLTWAHDRGERIDLTDAGLGCNGYSVRPWPAAEAVHPNSWTVTRAIDFLHQRDPTVPFLLQLSFHRPHPPLDPPAWCLDRYADVDLPELAVGDWQDPDVAIRHITGDESPIPDSMTAIDRARRGYYAQLTHIDNQLNRLVHALQEAGLYDSSMIVFLGDHGEQLFDHRAVGKFRPFEASSRVPLLVRLPSGMASARRHHVDVPVELRDVLPTLCAMGGVAVPDEIDGADLLPLLTDETLPEWRDVVHGEHYMASMADNHWLSDGTTKYAWYAGTGEEQLFDLVADPTETRDLSATSDLSTWRDRLVAELDGREEGYVRDGQLTTDGVGRPVLEAAGLLSDEAAEQQLAEAVSMKSYFDSVGRPAP